MAAESFASALAHGGVGYVARQIAQATHPFTIVQNIRRAYRGMSMQEVGQLYQLGVGAYSAGQYLTGPTSEGIAPLEAIPINPDLSIDTSAGNRFRFQTLIEFQIPGEPGSRYATVNIATPDNLSLSELQALADDYFSQLVSRGGRYVGQTAGSLGVVKSISVLDLERAY